MNEGVDYHHRSKPLRTNDIRDRNDKLVLRCVLTRKKISQSQVVKGTGLKAPTVLRIFRDLKNSGLIRISDAIPAEASCQIGRKPVLYEPNPDALYTVGVDFWALSATAVVANFCGEPIARKTESFPPGVDAEEVYSRLIRIVKAAIREAGIEKADVLGVGVGSPGVVDISSDRVVYYSRIRNMQDFELGKRLSRDLGIPATVHNNGAVIALSEYKYGTIQDIESLMIILVRGGIGCGFIREGRVFISRGRTALEIGHMCMNFEDEKCPSGERGCLEKYINEQIVLDEVARAFGPVKIEDLDRIIEHNESEFGALLERPVKVLAHAVVTLSNLVNPEVFVIVSRSRRLALFLAEKVARYVDLYKYTGKDTNVRVVGVEYDPVRASRGVADMVLEKALWGDKPLS